MSLFGIIIFILSLGLSFGLRGKDRLSLISWGLLGLGMIYGLGATATALWLPQNPSTASPLLSIIRNNVSLESSLYYYVATIILVAGLVAGWKSLAAISSRYSAPKKRPSPSRLPIISAWVLLITAFLTQLLYTWDYGGFSGIFNVSRLIRSGLIAESELSRFSFLSPFGGLALISSYLFHSLLYKRRNSAAKLGVLASFVFAVYILLSRSGRLSMIKWVAVHGLIWLTHRRARPRRVLIGALLAVPTGLVALFSLSTLFNLKSKDRVSDFIVHELSFIYSSFYTALKYIQLQGASFLRGFLDLAWIPMSWLPSSMTRDWDWLPKPVLGDLNTELILGAKKGVDGVTGSIPVDLLSFGFYQGHLLGVAVSGFFFGVFLFLLQISISRLPKPFSIPLYSYAAVNIALGSVFYFGPTNFAGTLFPLVVSVLVVISINFIFRTKRRPSLDPAMKTNFDSA